jgi:anti-sigma B factor antagonist
MKLEKRRYDDVVILKFVGEFDAFNLPNFSSRIDSMIEAGDRQLVLDLHALKFINSAALGYLIKTSKRVKGLGGEVVIARPSKFVQRTLSTLGLDGVFTAYTTVEDGILHFKRGQGTDKIDLSQGGYDETLTGALPILFRKDDKSTLPPNQVGRIVTLYEDGLLFRYEPDASSGKDPVEADLVEGVRLKMKFRQPFAVKDYYFEITGTISQVSRISASAEEDAVTTVRVRYERIRDEDRNHLQQFVRDLDSWRRELGERP